MSESLFSENIFNSPVDKMINDVISLCVAYTHLVHKVTPFRSQMNPLNV